MAQIAGPKESNSRRLGADDARSPALRTPAAVSQHGYRSPLGPVPTNFVPPGLGPPRAPGAGQRHFRGRLSPARQPINGQSALRSEVNRGSNVALRFDLADHAGGRAPDVGIDHAAGVVGGIRGGRHRAGQLVQVDQSGGVATFADELTAMASVRSTGPVSTANTRRRADQARASRGPRSSAPAPGPAAHGPRRRSAWRTAKAPAHARRSGQGSGRDHRSMGHTSGVW